MNIHGPLCAILALVCLGQSGAGQTTPPHRELPPPTWSEEVASIVWNRCSRCHREGEVAPFPLVEYEEVARRARTIRRVIERGIMPPWHPVEGHGEFAGDLSRRPQEKDALLRWIEAETPLGPPEATPDRPEWPSGWYLGEPDLVLEMPTAFEVPADGPDIYRSFVLPLDLQETRWIRAIEVRPSEGGALHHVIFSMDRSGNARELDGADGQPGFRSMGLSGLEFTTSPNGGNWRSVLRGRNGGGVRGLGGWAVGGLPVRLPEGLARELPAGSDLVLQSHLHPTGRPALERTKIGLHFAEAPSTRTLLNLQLPPAFGIAAGLELDAGRSDQEIADDFVLPVDVEAFTVGGHAHYLGKEMQVTVQRPGEEPESVFWIDDWDFDWQSHYQYAEPLQLPAGTRVSARVRFDNSADNPNNPFSPPQDVSWGRESTDEMGSVTLLMAPVDEADARSLQRALRDHRRAHLREGIPQIARGLSNGAGRRVLQRILESRFAEMEEAEEEPQGAHVVPLSSLRESLLDREAEAALFVFTTTDCPIANSYAPELARIAEEYAARGVRTHLVHLGPDLAEADALAHAREYGLELPLVLDPEQVLAQRFGIRRTPEAALLDAEEELVYRGRIDDLWPALGSKRQAPDRRDLRLALDALLAGEPIAVSRTEAVGCSLPRLP